ncbi:MAG: hypothetical protein MJ150_02305 [Clostridia bacterium]|nr:hypothetical protein [Clostridia bacterium]
MDKLRKQFNIRSHRIVDLMPVVLLALFAFCVLFVIISGTGVYRRIVSGSDITACKIFKHSS